MNVSHPKNHSGCIYIVKISDQYDFNIEEINCFGYLRQRKYVILFLS